VNMAYFLVNRSPSSAIEWKTPKKVWSGKPVNYFGLCIFECPVYAHASNGKLEPRTKKCIFMDYAHRLKGYRLWCTDPRSPNFLISRDVIFDETAMLQ